MDNKPIQTGANRGTVKEMKARAQAAKDAEIKQKCEAIAIERLGSLDALVKLSNQHKGLWFLPIVTEDGEIEKLALMRPIDRTILSYASTKLGDDGGLYDFLEAGMRECIITDDNKLISDMEIIEDDDYFIPAANSFNKILEGKKASLLKR